MVEVERFRTGFAPWTANSCTYVRMPWVGEAGFGLYPTYGRW